MPFYLYFFTHSQVFHKCSLKSPLSLLNLKFSLLNFPQIPYLILSGFLLSSPLYRFTKSLNYSQKIAAPFFAICVWSQALEMILHPWRQLKTSRAGFEAGGLLWLVGHGWRTWCRVEDVSEMQEAPQNSRWLPLELLDMSLYGHTTNWDLLLSMMVYWEPSVWKWSLSHENGWNGAGPCGLCPPPCPLPTLSVENFSQRISLMREVRNVETEENSQRRLNDRNVIIKHS